MAVQHHLDIEQTQNYGTNIHPGQEVFIGVSIALTTTHPGVRTRFYPQERDCYFQDEVVLKHLSHKFYRYSMGNCLTEAYLQNTEKKCNCTRRVAHKQLNVNYTYCTGMYLNISRACTVHTKSFVHHYPTFLYCFFNIRK